MCRSATWGTMASGVLGTAVQRLQATDVRVAMSFFERKHDERIEYTQTDRQTQKNKSPHAHT